MRMLSKTRPIWWVFALVALLAATPMALAEEDDDGWIVLFDGTSLDGWQMAGPGSFLLLEDGSMLSQGGMGLLQYAERPFRDFILELEWKAERPNANSGIFVRFPQITNDPWHAVSNGYEIQIEDGRAPHQVTGSIYDIQAPTKVASKPAGEWNHYRIQVTGQRYQIWLNGELIQDFIGNRGREGYIGLQNHDPGSLNYYRNVRVKELASEEVPTPETWAEVFAIDQEREPIRVLMITANYGEQMPSTQIAAQRMKEIEATTEFEFTITDDIGYINAETLANYDVLFFANTTGEMPLRPAQQQAIMDFLLEGKGFFGTSTAAATNKSWAQYRDMLGGYMIESVAFGPDEGVDVLVEEVTHPAVAHLAEGRSTKGNYFSIRDRIYKFDGNVRWNSRVLLSLDPRSVGIEQGPAGNNTYPGDNDYPLAWCRPYNGGRVVYTALGAEPNTWNYPFFIEHVLQSLRVAAGRVSANCTGYFEKEQIIQGIWAVTMAVDKRGDLWIGGLNGDMWRWDHQTGEVYSIGSIGHLTPHPQNIEHGLLGIEVDPNFYEGEPYVYLYYTREDTFINTLSRFEFRDGQVDLSTEKVLLEVPTFPTCCHQAGDLEWSPDGQYLFISTGDTGQSTVDPRRTDEGIGNARVEAFRQRYGIQDQEFHWVRLVDSEYTAQNLQELRGKILRIHKDGSIPKDNPFYGVPGVRWEIWAYGLRNPYRFHIDPETGEMIIGVVGPDSQFDYDEFNLASPTGGENFGWPRETGGLIFNEMTEEHIPNYAPPIWEYLYASGGGRSALGGVTYRSDGEYAFPPIFQGRHFILDWSRNWIKWAFVEDGRLVDIRTFDVTVGSQPIDLIIGPDGSLFLANFTGFWTPGGGAMGVTRYRWIEGNIEPVAVASSTPWSGQAPLTVQFSSHGSYDPNATALTYHWDFGDGHTSNEPNPTHTFTEEGIYEVKLVVTNAGGEGVSSEPATVQIVVGNTAPTPRIISPVVGALYQRGSDFTIVGAGYDPEDGDLPAENLEWTVVAEYVDRNVLTTKEIARFNGFEGTIDIPDEFNEHSDTRIIVTLKATDSEGLTDTAQSVVRFARLQAQGYDSVGGFRLEATDDVDGEQHAVASASGNYLSWHDIDLTGRGGLPLFLRFAPGRIGGSLEVRLDGVDGELLGTVEVSGAASEWQTGMVMLPPTLEGMHDVYVVAKAPAGQENTDIRVNWIQFVGVGAW